MNELAVVSTVLGILGTVCAIVFGLATYKRNRKKDDSDEGKQSGTVLTEIGYIKSGIDDIKAEQREQRNTNTQFLERLTQKVLIARLHDALYKIRAHGKRGHTALKGHWLDAVDEKIVSRQHKAFLAVLLYSGENLVE